MTQNTNTYAPSPLYMLFKTWRDRYGVSSPEKLREIAAKTENTEETRNICRTARDWELDEYRLSAVEDVINRYDRFNAGRTP